MTTPRKSLSTRPYRRCRLPFAWRSVLLTSLVCVSSIGCDGRGATPGESVGTGGGTDGAAEPEKPNPVVTRRAARATIEATIRSASTIEAERQVTVHAEATGRISKLSCEEGASVKKGARLGQIERDAQASQLERASANLEKIQSDYDRIRGLFDQGMASKEELENAKSTLRGAQIDRRDRRREVGDTRVLAPFAGTVTERFVNDGAFVTSGAKLYSIVDFSSLVARVYVPERELDRIQVGQDARIEHKAGSSRHGVGTVQRIAPIVDSATGTIKITVALPESLTGARGFLPGMYAEVTLTTDLHDDTLVLPKPALIREEDQVFVFVVVGDRAKRVKVDVGLGDENQVEILAGISAGDEFIFVGHAGLKDGALVERVDERGKPLTENHRAAGDTSSAGTANEVASVG